MATIPTLIASSAEEGILEFAEKLLIMQNTTAQNPNAETIISGFTRNHQTGAISFEVTLGSSTSIDSAGRPVVDVDEVFVD